MNQMIFRHFSSDRFVFNPQRHYFNHFPDSKPEGFWIDTPSSRDWPYICNKKDFRKDRRTEHIVTLKRNANILYLHSVEDVKWFHNTYAEETERQPYQLGNRPQKEKYEIIQWHKVAEEYDGIFITFFDEQFAEFLDWFWAWDLVSGCIWNLNAIKDVVRVGEVVDISVVKELASRDVIEETLARKVEFYKQHPQELIRAVYNVVTPELQKPLVLDHVQV